MLKVCLDPGHGMGNRARRVYDPGAVGGGVAEADIALQWAKAAKFYLVQAGIEVVMTRDDAEDHAPVSGRDDFARDKEADLLISIHCNSSVQPWVHGTETIYREDRRLAELVNGCALRALGSKNRGLKLESQLGRDKPGRPFELAVLNFGWSCLVELDFISNRDARRRMLERNRRAAWGQDLAARLKEPFR